MLASNHRTHKPPKKKKKKKTPRKPISHQAPRPTSQLSTVVDPLAICCRPISHLSLTPSSPSTTIAKDIDHRRCQNPRQAAATPPQFEPPLSSPSSRCHSCRSLASHVHCRTFFLFYFIIIIIYFQFRDYVVSFRFCGFLF